MLCYLINLRKDDILSSREVKRIQTARGGGSGFCFISRQILHFRILTVGIFASFRASIYKNYELPIFCRATVLITVFRKVRY